MFDGEKTATCNKIISYCFSTDFISLALLFKFFRAFLVKFILYGQNNTFSHGQNDKNLHVLIATHYSSIFFGILNQIQRFIFHPK
jgi:hypothetical protein